MAPKQVLVPTFELVSNPTIHMPSLIRCMRARKAREQGCIVVWNKGRNPCVMPDIVDLARKRKGR